ncbi:Ger(x)C family spore germination protein [Halocella sp. SP3-1]|uniref:Ger(x)C family spore germination protein n=1 Tax=Halocella sp. SP3-1 TaxID=2382161 RepID=UPI000F757E0F|nr:Ger(x)C family spore germination protein [Halocella sp. SP3-1]AZO93609.1 Ger(x)C family spore germination protein [Halocella sp. SP3-1]MTI61871.1 Ger(x)C family spore germination protein [Bacillota bacterium]
MKKSLSILMIIILTISSLTGCWDLKDIDQRAIILAIGIDYADVARPNNFEQRNMIKLTAQLAIPQKLGGGAGQQLPMGEETVWNITAVGRNVAMALMHLKERLQHRIFLGHIRVLVINEEVARDGLNVHLNYFRNNPEFRRLSYLLISEKPAERVLNTFPKTAPIQALYLMNMIESELNSGTMADIPFIEFVIRLVNKGIDPVAVLIDCTENNLKNSGLAVFRGEKMVGKLNVEETWNYIQIAEKRTGGLEVVRDVEDELGRVTVEFSGLQSKMRPILLDNGRFRFMVDLLVEGKSIYQETQTDYENSILFRQLEERVSKEFIKEIEGLFYLVQHKYQADIFGFGEMVRAYKPEEWENIESWHKKFIEADLNLSCRTRIRRIGMSTFKQK